MPRTIQINAVRLLGEQTPFNLATNTGQAVAQYVACTVTTTNGVNSFQDRPNDTLFGTATVPIAATDNAATTFPKLLGLIAQQEGLRLKAAGGTDSIFDSAGNQIA